MNQPIEIGPPVLGHWTILNRPRHVKGAFDFVAVNDSMSPYKEMALFKRIFSTISVVDTLAWDKPVFAVMDGMVVAAGYGVQDLEKISPLRNWLRLTFLGGSKMPPFIGVEGNYVILKCGDVYPLYASLKNDTICVRPGDIVRKGDKLGHVGNSGSSLYPHLHFQIMSSHNPYPLFENLIPFVIPSGEIYRKQKSKFVACETLLDGDCLRL